MASEPQAAVEWAAAQQPGPFALGDAGRFAELLAETGFTEVSVEDLELVRRHSSFEEFWDTTLDISRQFHDAAMSLPEPQTRSGARGPAAAPGAVHQGGRDAGDPGPYVGGEGERLSRPLACAPMIYDDDADLGLLAGKTVAIIGYGSQGHAHALNLKDSGVDVVVGLREDSSSVAKAREQGLEVLSPVEAASRGNLIMILVPDELHREVWENELRDGVAEGDMLLFGHGFSIHYKEVTPPSGVDVGMVAPKGPGHLVRRQFTEGSGVPGPDRDRAGRLRAGPRARRLPTPRGSAAPAAG